MGTDDMTKPLLSVIIPAYNLAEFLPNSLRSIFNQSYSKLEIIIVDDGSTDATDTVLKELASQDQRLRILHQKNKGVTSARLAGIEAAKGEWIGFADGDDEIEPDMYERLLSNALSYDADISHCGYQMVFPSHTDYYYNTGQLICQDHQTALQDLIQGSFVEPGLWNKLYRKKLFQNLPEKMDASIKIMEDLLMNYYLFQEAEKSVYEDFCPYHYIVREGSAATAHINEHKLKDPLKVLKTIKRESEENAQLQEAVNMRLAGCLIRLATMESGDQEELIAPFQTQAREELKQLLPELAKCGSHTKIRRLAAWAAFLPDSYRLVHSLYSKLRGTDKKYEVR